MKINDNVIFLDSDENHYKMLKEYIGDFIEGNILVLLDDSFIDCLEKQSFDYINFKNRGVIYFDNNMKEYLTYKYNNKLKSHVILEAKFGDLKYNLLLNNSKQIKLTNNRVSSR